MEVHWCSGQYSNMIQRRLKYSKLFIWFSFLFFSLVYTNRALSQASAGPCLVWGGAGQPAVGKLWIRNCLGKLDVPIDMRKFSQLCWKRSLWFEPLSVNSEKSWWLEEIPFDAMMSFKKGKEEGSSNYRQSALPQSHCLASSLVNWLMIEGDLHVTWD